jgi:hypothetical protein
MGRNRRPHATQTCNADAHLDAPLGEVSISLAQADTAVMPAKAGTHAHRHHPRPRGDLGSDLRRNDIRGSGLC